MQIQTEPEAGYSHSANPGYGVRPMFPDVVKQAEAFAGLPDNMTRWDILDLVKQAGRDIGFTPELTAHLEQLMKYTHELDWLPGGRPIVFRSVSCWARDLDISERQVNNREEQLHRLGALVWNDNGNFKRFGHRDPSGRLRFGYGVDLSPLPSLVPRLRQALERKRVEQQLWTKERQRVSSAKRAVRHKLEQALVIPALQEAAYALQEKYEELCKTRVRGSTPLSTLYELTQRAGLLDEALHTLLEMSQNCGKPVDTSDQNEPDCRHYNITIQPPISFEKNTSNPSGDNERSDAHAPQAGRILIDPENGVETGQTQDATSKSTSTESACGKVRMARQDKVGAEAKPERNTKAKAGGNRGNAGATSHATVVSTGVEHLTTRQLYHAASDLFIAHLPHSSTIDWSDFVRAASDLAPAIGINKTAWDDACFILGRAAAAVCVLVADRRRTDPMHPVNNPGGFLRGCIKKAQEGQLHLHRSIFGLLNKGDGHDA